MYRLSKVKDAIKKKYGSYNKFALDMKVDRSTVTKWLNGSRRPNYETAVKITRKLDCTLEDVYGPVAE